MSKSQFLFPIANMTGPAKIGYVGIITSRIAVLDRILSFCKF